MKREKEREQRYLRISLALRLVPMLGTFRIKTILDSFEEPEDIFGCAVSRLAQIQKIGPHLAEKIIGFRDWKRVDALLEEAETLEAVLLTPYHSGYPELLRQIYDPPAILWVKGHVEALQHAYLAVVGTRTPGSSGKEMATKLTYQIGKSAHLGIISGLASGIDTLAHHAALESDAPTIAVLGSGIDWIYPRGNIPLAYKIIKTGGAIISELLPGSRPDACNFPSRNRIVSGMSLGVLVIESGLSGGSLITARQALDQNREVFIVPHDVRNPIGEGCNRYIQRGWGKLVLTASDILEELPRKLVKAENGEKRRAGSSEDVSLFRMDHVKKKKEDSNPNLSALTNSMQKKICQHLQKKGSQLHIDEMAAQMQTSSFALLPELLHLELEGIIIQKPGKNFQLCS